jgi:hypothetical protein
MPKNLEEDSLAFNEIINNIKWREKDTHERENKGRKIEKEKEVSCLNYEPSFYFIFFISLKMFFGYDPQGLHFTLCLVKNESKNVEKL